MENQKLRLIQLKRKMHLCMKESVKRGAFSLVSSLFVAIVSVLLLACAEASFAAEKEDLDAKQGSKVMLVRAEALSDVERELFGRKAPQGEKKSRVQEQEVATETKEEQRPARPVNGTLSSRYGSRWGRNHNGIDLAAQTGTPIYAAESGRVTYAEFNDGGYGYMVKLDHGNGLETYYAHCSELCVKAGDVVTKGGLIAKVGSTGRSTGPHLHFEVRRNGVPEDPYFYLNNLE